MDNIIKAIRYITDIRDKNYVTLDNFKKEIEANKNSKIHYSTLVYDNRIKNCNTVLEALEKQIPKKVIKTEKFSQACPVCGISTNWHYCPNCGQKLSY